MNKMLRIVGMVTLNPVAYALKLSMFAVVAYLVFKGIDWTWQWVNIHLNWVTTHEKDGFAINAMVALVGMLWGVLGFVALVIGHRIHEDWAKDIQLKLSVIVLAIPSAYMFYDGLIIHHYNSALLMGVMWWVYLVLYTIPTFAFIAAVIWYLGKGLADLIPVIH